MFKLNPIAWAIHGMFVERYNDYRLFMADPQVSIQVLGVLNAIKRRRDQ